MQSKKLTVLLPLETMFDENIPRRLGSTESIPCIFLMRAIDICYYLQKAKCEILQLSNQIAPLRVVYAVWYYRRHLNYNDLK